MPGVIGIRNHGNTCFINSILQCLSYTDILAEYFVLDQYKSDLKRRKRLSAFAKATGTGKGEVPMPKGFGLIAPSDKKRDFSLGQMSTLDRRKTTDVVGTWFFHSYVRRNGKSPTTKVNVG